jgi:hypothetical protein
MVSSKAATVWGADPLGDRNPIKKFQPEKVGPIAPPFNIVADTRENI